MGGGKAGKGNFNGKGKGGWTNEVQEGGAYGWAAGGAEPACLGAPIQEVVKESQSMINKFTKISQDSHISKFAKNKSSK